MSSKMTKKATKGSGYCLKCQLKRGAKEPRGGLIAVTCKIGKCLGCKEEEMHLIYDIDLDWPAKGKRAVWD